jgi:large subunit ribosomal protein L15
MRIHEFAPTTKRKKVKHIGRGGKRGTFSGRGQKGQGARAGHRIRPAIRDLYMRLPKLRGVKHQSLKEKPTAVNISALETRCTASVITKKTLVEAGIIRRETQLVKILGSGTITRAVKVTGIPVSAEARKKIEAAGGSVHA